MRSDRLVWKGIFVLSTDLRCTGSTPQFVDLNEPWSGVFVLPDVVITVTLGITANKNKN